MGKRIIVNYGVKAILAREFSCQYSTIDKALLGMAFTPKQRAIRQRAIELGGDYE